MAADKQNYISLLKASEHCNYSQDYLSLRARQGKLKSVKLGRNWVTTKEWLNDYILHNGGSPVKADKVVVITKTAEEAKEQYLSLHEAAQLCGYSQDYLSLRARQGKLKSVKLGRNWATTKKWLNEYVINFNGPDEIKKEPAKSAQELIEIAQPLIIDSTEVLKQIVGGEIAKIKEFKEKKLGILGIIKEKPPVLRPSFSFIWQHFIARRPANIAVCALVCILLVFGVVFKDPVNLKITQADYYLKQMPNIGYTIVEKGLANFSEIRLPDLPDLPDFQLAETAEEFSQNLFATPSHLKFYLKNDFTSALSLAKRITPKTFVSKLEIIKQMPLVLSEKAIQAGKDLAFSFYCRLSWETNQLKKAQQITFGLESAFLGLKEKSNIVKTDLSFRLADNLEESYAFLGGAKKIAGNFLQKLSIPFKALAETISKMPQRIAGIFQKEKILPESERKGLVVVPSQGKDKDEQMIEQIKQSFSDEVKVTPKDDTSGIIVPVFREREGKEYLYIMVPAKEND